MILQYNHATCTFAASLDCGRIFLDGFSDNCVFRGFHPEVFGKVPPIPEPRWSETIEKLTWIWSTNKYLGILAGRSVLYNYEENGEIVATALYYLPSQQRAKLSWSQWLYYHAYKLYFRARILLFHRQFYNKYFGDPVQIAFIDDLYSFGQTPAQAAKYRESLATKTYDELMEARYPMDDTLHLDTLAVRRDAHGRGYGSKLMNESLAYFKGEKPVFSNGSQEIRGPAKVSLIPTAGNDTFYARYGFKTVQDRPITSSDGRASCDVKFLEKVM